MNTSWCRAHGWNDRTTWPQSTAESNPVGFRLAIPNRFESIIPNSSGQRRTVQMPLWLRASGSGSALSDDWRPTGVSRVGHVGHSDAWLQRAASEIWYFGAKRPIMQAVSQRNRAMLYIMRKKHNSIYPISSHKRYTYWVNCNIMAKIKARRAYRALLISVLALSVVFTARRLSGTLQYSVNMR